MNQAIVSAIAQRSVIEFSYHGHARVAEPHVYGVKNGTEQLLIYQIGGTSSSGQIPEWRRVDVGAMASLVVTPRTFPGARPTPTGQHSSWDQTYAIVR
jgi:hypothetical protein